MALPPKLRPSRTRRQDSGTREERAGSRWKPSLARPLTRMNTMMARLFFTRPHCHPTRLHRNM